MLDLSEVTLDLHTGDEASDYIGPNPTACPALVDLFEDALKSEEYVQW